MGQRFGDPLHPYPTFGYAAAAVNVTASVFASVEFEAVEFIVFISKQYKQMRISLNETALY